MRDCVWKIWRFLYTKRFLVLRLASLQTVLFCLLAVRLYTAGEFIYCFMLFLNIISVFYLLGRDDINPAYKIFWILEMAFFPVTGVLFYVMYGDIKMSESKRNHMLQVMKRTRSCIKNNPEAIERIRHIDDSMVRQAVYLEKQAAAPAFINTSVKYYDTGAAYFRDLLKDIEKAEKSVFLQYFIIDEGYLWDRVLDALKRKAARGKDVRLIYDGLGCLINFPRGYEDILRGYGIKVCVFNDVRLSVHIGDYLMFNHRDHRKIAVIDSVIGYSGGMNLADEYINCKERFGVWKDTGFRIEGRAVQSLTVTFIQAWELGGGEKMNCTGYLPTYAKETDGIVQPYSDTPLDGLNVCESIYLSVINNAKKYVYIATPYLILDNEMLTALCISARSGVDVRIIVPGIPDKWYVYYVTQSYYKSLLDAGVKIYEYSPGFLHAKMYVTDDRQAIVGGANTDYRSMHLNFENCCSFYGGSIPGKVKKDFIDMFSHSRCITGEDVESVPLFRRILQIVFRVVSPMI